MKIISSKYVADKEKFSYKQNNSININEISCIKISKDYTLEAVYIVEMVYIFPLIFFISLLILCLNFYLHDRVCMIAEMNQLAADSSINNIEQYQPELISKKLWLSELYEFTIEKKVSHIRIKLSVLFRLPIYNNQSFSEEQKNIITIMASAQRFTQAEKARIFTVGKNIVAGIRKHFQAD